MRPKILHILNRFDPGGMEKGVVKVISALAEEFSFSICCLERSGSCECLLPPGVAVWQLRRCPGKNLSLPIRLSRILWRERPAVIHSHSLGSLLYACAASIGLPAALIAGEHGDLYTLKPAKKYAFIRRCLAWRVARFQTVSEAMREDLARLSGISLRRITAIPNGVDTTRFRPAQRRACRSRLGLPVDGSVIGVAGRLTSLKRFDTVVRALPALQKPGQRVSLAVAGDGEERDRLERAAQEANCADRVFFLGHQERMENVFPCFDLLVHPSVSEGMSNVLLEAMACGVPVVASDIPANREVVVDGKTGALCRLPEEMVGVCRRLLDDRQRLAEMSTAAAAEVRARFPLAAMVAGYRLLYRSVIGRALCSGARKEGAPR